METAIVRDVVYADCARSANAFGPSFFEQHLEVVVEYAGMLARTLRADAESVELAGYLHDLSAVRDVSTLPDHANSSAALARRLLIEHGRPQDLVERVTRSIAAHSHPVPIGGGSPEEVCVSNADAMAQIARPLYWSYVVFGIRKQVFEAGRQWLLHLYEDKWNALIPLARELIGDRYLHAKQLLTGCSRLSQELCTGK